MILPLANIFQPLIDVCEILLKAFHSLGIGWGSSIIMMTIVIRAAMVPLALKQYRSMLALQRVAPQLKALQGKYKDDKARLQQETLKFYKDNQVNPFASCLPVLPQVPVFIALFYMLRHELRPDICPAVQAQKLHALGHAAAGKTFPCGAHNGADFLFIPDLTGRAHSGVLVALIVLYLLTTLGSSLLMAPPTMDKNQRMVMLFLPLVFVVFFIQYPAGLLVYWITSNLWTVSQQYVLRQVLGAPVAPPAAADGKGAAAEAARARPGPSPRAAAKASPNSGDVSAAPARRGPPPPPPRKKKKRSGRRR